MGLHGVQPPHPPPPPPNFKDCFKCKGRCRKKEKNMTVRDRGGGYLLTYLGG